MSEFELHKNGGPGNSHHKMVARIWPNGEFGIGFIKSVDASSALGSSNESNSHSEAVDRAERGSGGLTAYGAKMVRNAAYLLEKRYGIKYMTFATLTLPAMCKADWDAVMQNWSDILRVFLQRLKRNLVRAGGKGDIVGCVEVQPKRATKEQYGLPLHIHLICQGRKPGGTWFLRTSDYRQYWRESVMRYAKNLAEEDFGASEHVVQVQQSCEKYLAKYMSKECNGGATVEQYLSKFAMPHAWWFCSQKLKDAVKENTRYSTKVAKDLLYYIKEKPKFLEWAQEIWVGEGSEAVFMGWCGRIGQHTFIRSSLGLSAGGEYEWGEEIGD